MAGGGHFAEHAGQWYASDGGKVTFPIGLSGLQGSEKFSSCRSSFQLQGQYMPGKSINFCAEMEHIGGNHYGYTQIDQGNVLEGW